MDSGWDDAILRAEVKALRRRAARSSLDGSAPSAATLKTSKPLASRRSSTKKKKSAIAEKKTRKKHRPYHTTLATSWLTCKLPGHAPIRLGTECSGLESVMVAMNMMSSRTELQFACEKDPAARRLILEHTSPKHVFVDITTRPVDAMPFCDVYVSGFPCQPWSTAGLSEGIDDRHGRGCIFPYIHEYLKTKQPTCFILENVKGFTTVKHKDAFANVLKALRSGLKDQYMVSWRVVNTADYGLPQNRPRLYIIGMLRGAIQNDKRFKWPRPVGCVPLESLLEKDVCAQDYQPTPGTTSSKNLRMLIRRQANAEPSIHPLCFDVFASKKRAAQVRPMVGLVPCLTRTRAGCGGYWVTGVNRLLTTREMLRLQGLPHQFIEYAAAANVSDRQLRQMIGNGMSVNVLVAILSRVLPAVGLG
jgi:DNA (cytosine-5)-methyltransferase 1